MILKKWARLVLTFCLLVVFSGVIHAQSCREVVGYYASWKWYKRNKLVNPETIDYSRYTIINYAFFKPLPSGELTEGDLLADKTILLGKTITQNGISFHDPSSSLVTNAHRNNVKVVASAGGWSWSSDFPAIAADPVKRKMFAASCVDKIRTYNLDGIDIDWEFPGGKMHNGSPADKQNFTLLLGTIREALDEYGRSTGRELLLTAAFGPAPVHLDCIEWDKVIPLLDIVHLMTYNYYGPWDKITNHNTPLYPAKKGSPVYAISSSIQYLTSVHNVPASKITLGIAFYGRTAMMTATPGLHAMSSGKADNLTFPEERGTPSYYNIVAKYELFNREWDATANVPYLTGKNGLGSFVSYDNPESVKLKAAYALKMKLRGAVIWDISGDYIETFPGSGKIAGTPLVDALQEAFCEKAAYEPSPELACEVDLVAYPNPFREEVNLTWNSACSAIKIVARNSSGQIVFSSDKISDGRLTIMTSGWTPGWYIIQLLSASGTTGQKVLKM